MPDEILPVTREEALHFLGHAFRNIEVPCLDDRDLQDVQDGLAAFERHRINSTAPSDGSGSELEAGAAEWLEYQLSIYNKRGEHTPQRYIRSILTALRSTRPQPALRDEVLEEAAKVAEDQAEHCSDGNTPYDDGAGSCGYAQGCRAVAAAIRALNPTTPAPETKP